MEQVIGEPLLVGHNDPFIGPVGQLRHRSRYLHGTEAGQQLQILPIHLKPRQICDPFPQRPLQLRIGRESGFPHQFENESQSLPDLGSRRRIESIDQRGGQRGFFPFLLRELRIFQKIVLIGPDTDAGNVSGLEAGGDELLMGGDQERENEGGNDEEDQPTPPAGLIAGKTAAEGVQEYPANPEQRS